MIRVRRMLRPEDTNIKNPHHSDLNLVFYTEKENVVSAERIEGMHYIFSSYPIKIAFKLNGFKNLYVQHYYIFYDCRKMLCGA